MLSHLDRSPNPPLAVLPSRREPVLLPPVQHGHPSPVARRPVIPGVGPPALPFLSARMGRHSDAASNMFRRELKRCLRWWRMLNAVYSVRHPGPRQSVVECDR